MTVGSGGRAEDGGASDVDASNGARGVGGAAGGPGSAARIYVGLSDNRPDRELEPGSIRDLAGWSVAHGYVMEPM
jgi:hypothetical protein